MQCKVPSVWACKQISSMYYKALMISFRLQLFHRVTNQIKDALTFVLHHLTFISSSFRLSFLKPTEGASNRKANKKWKQNDWTQNNDKPVVSTFRGFFSNCCVIAQSFSSSSSSKFASIGLFCVWRIYFSPIHGSVTQMLCSEKKALNKLRMMDSKNNNSLFFTLFLNVKIM